MLDFRRRRLIGAVESYPQQVRHSSETVTTN